MIVLNKGTNEGFITNSMPEEGGKVNVSTWVHPCYVLVYIIIYLKFMETKREWIHENHLQKIESQFDNLSQCLVRRHHEKCF